MKHTFRAVIQAGSSGGAFVRIPFDVEAEFGRKRVPILAAIDGVPYRGSLVRMGEPCHILGILKAIRQQTGKDIGDEVEITLEEDVAVRQVEYPADLRQALEAVPGADVVFEKMSYTHRKELVHAILDTKRDETRRRHIADLLTTLEERLGSR